MLETPIGIDLWINLGSPRCYLTLVSLRKALIASGQSNRFQLVVHPSFVAAVEEPLEPLRARAESLGIRFSEELHPASATDSAARLVAYAQQRDYQESFAGADPLHAKVAEALMRSRFELGLDLVDPDHLVGVGQDLGIAAEETLEAIASDATRELIAEGYSLALYLGVQEVPVLLFDEQYVVDGLQAPDSYRTILNTVLAQRGNDARGNES